MKLERGQLYIASHAVHGDVKLLIVEPGDVYTSYIHNYGLHNRIESTPTKDVARCLRQMYKYSHTLTKLEMLLVAG